MDYLTPEEERYLDEQKWLAWESKRILEENEKAEQMLAAGYCADCASGFNLYCGCYECEVHSGKRICMHPRCQAGPCVTEYDL